MPTDWPFDPETGELDPAPVSNLAEISVTDLAQALKRTLEDRFGHVRVRGEISGYRGPHASGHCYFAIKDAGAKLDAVIWRGSFGRLRSKLQEGLEVVATGKISSYPQKSGYQLIVEALEPAGVGALMALLEERRKLLAAEGLFNQARKKPLPFLPRVIGVITSPTGAVIRDILHRLNDRFARRVLVWPVRVQGEGSADEIAAAIRGFNALPLGGAMPRPDVLIVARGGGSLEDLWGFNEEAVVRAAAGSAVPLISAVGHETDTTLIDHAADWRAPTPTAAAERAVPVRAELLGQVAGLGGRLEAALPRMLNEQRVRLRAAASGLPRADDLLAQARQRLDSAAGRLAQSLKSNTATHRAGLTSTATRLTPHPLLRLIADSRQRLVQSERGLKREALLHLERRRRALGQAGQLLAALSYESVLQRGYAVVRDEKGGIIASAHALRLGQALSLQFADGSAAARAEGMPKPPSRKPMPEPGQGTLF